MRNRVNPSLYVRKENVQPVSYTHLDVYKRQGIITAQHSFCSHRMRKREDRSIQRYREDVYKRQITNHVRIKVYFSILVLFLLGLGGVLLYLAKGMKPLHLYIVEGIIAFILVFLFKMCIRDSFNI